MYILLFFSHSELEQDMEDKDGLVSTKTEAPKDNSETDTILFSLECAVCLQTCVHPVQLNCDHIFCFLCVKGVTTQSKRCPMCRREILPGYLEKPNLVVPSDPEIDKVSMQHDRYSWFYEGRNGWWEYEERAAAELEEGYSRAIHTDNEQAGTLSGDNNKYELLIAGFLYTIDFEQMIQYRRNEPHRQRKIKREKIQNVADCKGVAGLRIKPNIVSDEQVASIRFTNPLPSSSDSDTSTSLVQQNDARRSGQVRASEGSTNSADNNIVSGTDSQTETSEIDNLINNITSQLTNVELHSHTVDSNDGTQ